jgi:hypothetical protein
VLQLRLALTRRVDWQAVHSPLDAISAAGALGSQAARPQAMVAQRSEDWQC